MKLLCQLWALNESLQEFKKVIEDEDAQREAAAILEAHLEDPNEDEPGWEEEEEEERRQELTEDRNAHNGTESSV